MSYATNMSTTMDQPAPDPVTTAYLLQLIDMAGISQQEAARQLRVDPRTMRRWLAGDCSIPWANAELLRRLSTVKVACSSCGRDLIWTREVDGQFKQFRLRKIRVMPHQFPKLANVKCVCGALNETHDQILVAEGRAYGKTGSVQLRSMYGGEPVLVPRR
jgi:hypothetical protein